MAKKKGRPNGDPRKHKGESRFLKGLRARREAPLHDDAGPSFDQYGMLNVQMPKDDEVVLLKEVPAMHTGLPGGDHAGEKVQVGIAALHDDGSVALRYDEDAPLWAMQEIQAYADKIGYSLSTGGFTDGAP